MQVIVALLILAGLPIIGAFFGGVCAWLIGLVFGDLILGFLAEHGIVGAVSTLLTITGGHEHAVAAALGWASEALAVGSSAQAASALDRLRSEDAGQAAMLVADTARRIDPSTWPSLDAGAVWARDVVDAPAEVAPAVEQLLERVALVPSVPHALALVARLRSLLPGGQP